MENKLRTWLAALICALVIICAGTAVILVWNPGNLEKIYQKQIQVADKIGRASCRERVLAGV